MEKLEELKQLEEQYKAFEVKECEVYSRVTGYFRPLKQWNQGKQEEWDLRKKYTLPILIIEES